MIWLWRTFLVMVIALAVGVGVLLFSTPGLHLLAKIALPENVRIEGVSGRLIGPGEILGLEWSSATVHAKAGSIAWNHSSFSYSERGLRIDTVELAAVELGMTDEVSGDMQSVQIDSIHAAVWIDQNALRVEKLTLVHDLITLTGKLSLMPLSNPEVSAAIDWTIETADGVEWRGHSDASGSLETLVVSNRLIAPTNVELMGTLYDLIGEPSYEFTLQVPPIPGGLGVGQLDEISGEMQFRGTLTDISGDGQIGLPVLIESPVQITMSATRLGEQLSVDWIIHLQDIARANGNAIIDWQDDRPSIHARVQIESEPSALIYFDLPDDLSGEISAELSLDGQMHPQPSFNLQIVTLDGTLNGQPLSGSGGLSATTDTLIFTDLDLVVGVDHLSADGSVGETIDIEWQLDAPQIGDLLPGGAGAIHGHGKLQGDIYAPAGQADLALTEFAWRDWAIGSGNLKARFDIAADTIEVFALELGNIHWQDLAIDRVAADASGTPSNHKISLLAERDELRSSVELSGSLSVKEWSGRVDDIEIIEPVMGKWHLESPTSFLIGAGDLQLELGCLRSGRSQLCFRGSRTNGQPAQIHANMAGLPVAAITAWISGPYEYAGYLTADVTASIPQEGPPIGELQLQFEQLAIIDALLNQPILDDSSGTLHIFSSEDSLRAELGINFRGSDKFEGLLQTGHAPDDALSGYLRGSVANLEFIPLLFPQVLQFDGTMMIDARLDGVRSNPRLEGKFTIENGAAWLLDPGIVLRDIALEANADAQALNLSGSASSGDGAVNLDAELIWGDPLVGTLRITGEQFRLVNLSPMFIDVSPDLTATLNGQSVEIRGSIFVDRANLAPIDVSMSVSPSSDQILIGVTDEVPEEGFNVDTDITVRLGNNIAIDAYGLTGALSGTLQLQQSSRQPALARGSLAVSNGYFNAYGTKLDIERGRLIYRGGSVDNPGMDIRAERYAESIMAGVEVRGTLKDPEIRLISDPPMSRQKMLAFLMSGVPPKDVSSTSDILAMSTLGTSSQGPVIGFDVGGFSIGASSSSLNEYLSPDTYLSYLNEFYLRYRVSKKWSVEVGRGTQDSSVDVIRSFR